ncbi:hypothetical protein K9K77_01620 [Candidatus Babeliales bacterium]|nr:hypothetical protein [Candidatus Babeliales bacterium]
MGQKQLFFLIFFIYSLRGVEYVFEDKQEIKALVRQLVADTFDDIVNDPVSGALLLKNTFYKYTHPLRKKSVLDFPSFTHKHEKWKFSFFYNQITKGYYRESNSGMGSYLNIEQKGILEVLDELEFQNEKLPHVLGLLDAIKTQERRIGMIVQRKGHLKNMQWTFQIPFLYQAYNFYLSSIERQAIMQESLFTHREASSQVAIQPASQPAGESSGPVDFFKRHLLSDKIGFSDARLSFSFSKSWEFFITIPCAYALKKGIIGSYFDQNKKGTPFDLHADCVDLYVEGNYAQLRQNAFDYGLAALERASSVILENPLGNRGHVGLGIQNVYQKQLRDSAFLSCSGSIELVTPAKERRFIKTISDYALLDELTVSGHSTEPDSLFKVQELNQALQENLFPENYDVTVFPGIRAQADLSLSYTKGLWTVCVGGDLWYHSKEYFLNTSKDTALASRLDVETARQGYAMQQNIYARIEKKRSEESRWSYGFEGSTTLVSSGRGKDRFIVLYAIFSL